MPILKSGQSRARYYRKDKTVMRNHLIEKLKGRNGRKGFTLTEMLVVVAIIAVLCSILLISIVSISKNLRFKQRNDYAKTIFMAAQANLSEMRSDDSLKLLQGTDSNAMPITEALRDTVGFPQSEWSDEYVYTGSEMTVGVGQRDSFTLVLPANSVESTLRSQKIIIEYNPQTGNVYSVFYSEENDSLLSQYAAGDLPREAAQRKRMMLGYYDGTGLSSTELELARTSAEVEFTNGEEGIVTVRIPMPSLFSSSPTGSAFADGLDVTLTLTGETSGGQIMLNIKTLSTEDTDLATWTRVNSDILVQLPLDSLRDCKSFANIAAQENALNISLTNVKSESQFILLPGENLTIEADVTYSGSTAAVIVDPGIITGVNPMFEYLEPSSVPGKYILAVGNGRNLQNLNAIAPSMAASIENVVFTRDISWNSTMQYYTTKYGINGTYTNAASEAPARALPYFVPIHNEALFGTTWFSTDPTAVMQDNHDAHVVNGQIVANDHADIVGNGYKVVGLNIDSTRYAIPSGGEYYVTTGYQDASGAIIGGEQTVNYNFTGLFAYLNTNISDLYVVNSFIKGLNFGGDANRTVATGSLVGASGYNTLISSCGAYILKDPSIGYDASAMSGPKDYSTSGTQTWYGVSGEGSVGGLVGYAKSHRTASGELTDNTSELAFSRSFAAVPVSGNMRGNTNKNYGYTNGVGGFAGNVELANFYNCYASGTVKATGCYTHKRANSWRSLITYEGMYSMGAGGFTGTSHGSRYTNCFATGDVTGNGSTGIGGFVGVMCYDEGFNYIVSGVSQRIEQLTTFDSCYAVGKANSNETFSGGNAAIYPDRYVGSNNHFYTDYYQMLAPYCFNVFRFGNNITYTPGYSEYNGKNVPWSGRDYYYVYKDSYYLNRTQVSETAGTSSSGCASAANYAHLSKLHINHSTDSAWCSAQFYLYEAYKESNNSPTYKTQYFLNGKTSSSAPYWTHLKSTYLKQLAEGYPTSAWTSATAATTHSYSINGGTYPFSMLSGMHYYGDWPTYPLTGGLAYYEYYNDYNNIYAYLDRANTSTLRNANDLKKDNAYVVSDGYAVAASSSDLTIKVKLGSKTFDLTSRNTSVATWNYGGTTVSLYPLTKAILDYASSLVASEGFYVQMTLTISNREYIVYFNPNAAITQVNPVMTSATTHTNPTKPADLPGTIEIRTARQLAGLSTMSGCWTAGHNYVQMLDIDASTYTAKNYSANDQTAIKNAIKAAAPIGTEQVPFQGSYDGQNGYLEQSTIENYTFTGTDGVGIFGSIGNTGAVKNLSILVGDGKNALDLGSNSRNSVGILADSSNGTIDNVDVTLNSAVTLTAKNAAGLLAGTSGGTISNCDITAQKAVTINATNAGGAVGQTTGGTMTDNTLTFADAYAVTATNAGGFIGSAAETIVQGGVVTLNGTFNGTATTMGGFAGTIQGGSCGSVSVNLKKATGSSIIESVGGFAGNAASAAISDAAVTIDGTLTGKTAAGLLAGADAVTAGNSTININAAVSGTAAAGAVGQATGSNSFSGVYATINGTTVSSADGIAAGFAVTLSGNGSGCTVELRNGAISGKETAGFAHTISGKLSDKCAVIGKGQINGTDKAAGFVVDLTGSGQIAGARVTPATAQTAAAYWGNSNNNMAISGSTAAGFALNVDQNANIQNCDALCALTGDTISGFADTNAGRIDGCIGNVTLTGGYAFVRENSGIVQYSYCWYGDGIMDNNTTVVPTKADEGHYYSSYFADINVMEDSVSAAAQTVNDPETTDEGTEDPSEEPSGGEAPEATDPTEATEAPTEADTSGHSVVLFSASGTYSTCYPSDLAAALSQLNTDSTVRWMTAGSYRSYPYSINGSYPYPMLREHCGNWVTAPQYGFGVVYYEIYSDNSLKFHVLELSDPEDTVDSAAQTGYWTITAGGNATMSANNCLNKDGTITETGYLLFCKTGANPFGGEMIGAEYTGNSAIVDTINRNAGASNRYSVYTLASDAPIPLNSSGVDIEVVPYFADAINAGDAYQIRTAAQLANISRMEANFVQTHDITVSDNFTPSSIAAKYTYNGNGCAIDASAVSNTWLYALNGTVKDLTLTVGDAASPLFETIGETGSIAGVNLTVGTITDNGAVIGSTAGTVTFPSITVTGVTGTGKLMNQMTAGTVTLSDVTVSGETVPTLFGEITGGEMAVSKMALNNVSGNLFGAITGNAKLTGTTITVKDLGGSLIGTLSGVVSNTSLTADSATVGDNSGVLVNTIDAGYSSTIHNSTVKVGTVDSSADIFGIITGTTPSTTTISDCTVTATTINASGATVGGLVGSNAAAVSNTKITAAVNTGANATVGGMMGSNSGNITDSSAAVTINAADSAVVGGLVGVNTSYISASTAAADINYTQNSAASAVVGGLVGQMDGGFIGDTGTNGKIINVSGSIDLESQNNTTDKTYIVGGVIGSDSTNTTSIYNNITSSVTVDIDWAGNKAASENVTDPAGIGPVGMFIGYVHSGEFNNCAVTENTNKAYQFLGQIECSSIALGDSGSAAWFSHSTQKETNSVEDLATNANLTDVAQDNGYTPLADTDVYYGYTAELNNCTFYYNSKQYTQTFNASQNFFLGSLEQVAGGFTKTQVTGTNPSFKTSSYYMITSSGDAGLYLDSNDSVTAAKIQDDNSNITNYCLWTVTNGVWRNVGNTNKYLSPGKDALISNSADSITVTSSNNNLFQFSRRSSRNTYYIRYSTSTTTNAFSSTNERRNASALRIYEVTQSAPSATAHFKYQKSASQCAAMDGSNNVLAPTDLNALLAVEEILEEVTAPIDETIGGDTGEITA